MKYVLAQVNVGRILGSMDGPVMRDFAGGLEEVNTLAERSPGFVWRLQTEAGHATDLRPFDDDFLLINMSSWESLETLHAFTYGVLHASILRRRREWFSRLAEAHSVLWWQPRDVEPTIPHAIERLEFLRAHGPTPFAFTFGTPFAEPGTIRAEPPLTGCPS